MICPMSNVRNKNNEQCKYQPEMFYVFLNLFCLPIYNFLDFKLPRNLNENAFNKVNQRIIYPEILTNLSKEISFSLVVGMLNCLVIESITLLINCKQMKPKNS